MSWFLGNPPNPIAESCSSRWWTQASRNASRTLFANGFAMLHNAALTATKIVKSHHGR